MSVVYSHDIGTEDVVWNKKNITVLPENGLVLEGELGSKKILQI